MGFFSSSSTVRKMGSYSKERLMAVLGLTGLIAGALAVGIGLTVLLAIYVNKTAGGIVFLLMCLGLAFGVMPYVDRKFFRMRAAFAYIATEVLIRKTPMPEEGTVAQATTRLSERFGSLDPVVDAHNNVQRLSRSFFRAFDKFDHILPIDLNSLRSALVWVVNRIAPRIADIALSYAVARQDKDIKESSKDAVALVAQNPKPLIGAAVRSYLTEQFLGGLFGFLFTAAACAAVFALAYKTSGSLTHGIPVDGAKTVGVFAGGFASLLIGIPVGALAAWFLRTAYLEPIGLTMLLARFHSTIEGQSVDPAMRTRIENASSNLRKASKLLG
ncbi:MAG TPA: hypothetical protein VFX30_02870 [bacterium]|nr:hypothetical protein [bacterium]